MLIGVHVFAAPVIPICRAGASIGSSLIVTKSGISPSPYTFAVHIRRTHSPYTFAVHNSDLDWAAYPVRPSKCNLSKCNLSKCNLSKCNLSKCNLSKCNLSKCNLGKCNLGMCNLGKCNLGKCNLATEMQTP
ncbi:MAG: hypothetical protein EXR77_07470 [Myxococcales bacterium]|nr:hypothetical protein [Myxococcales bacterium]